MSNNSPFIAESNLALLMMTADGQEPRRTHPRPTLPYPVGHFYVGVAQRRNREHEFISRLVAQQVVVIYGDWLKYCRHMATIANDMSTKPREVTKKGILTRQPSLVGTRSWVCFEVLVDQV